ncbi:MAG: hypothetical protein WAL80_21635 [Xanthobacteraceae bacterium]
MIARSSSSGSCRSAGRCALVALVVSLVPASAVRAQMTPPPAAGAAPATSAPAAPAPGQAAAPATPPASSSAVALPPQPPPSLPPQPPEKRGFLNDFGSWWNKSVADFNAKVKDQQSKLDDFNKQSAAATQDAMKSTFDALRPSKLVEMHEVCAIAGNGAPDCAPAVTNACRAKGYKSGEPVDIRTAEKCSASLWVSGQQAPTSGDCPNETVVLRAACQ